MVGDCLDLGRCFQHPAFAPSIDDAVLTGPIGQEREWQLEDDCIAVLPCSGVLAGVDETKIPVLVLPEAVAAPGQWTGRQISFDPVAPIRLVRVIVEEIVTLE